jgi:hypothetical protein
VVSTFEADSTLDKDAMSTIHSISRIQPRDMIALLLLLLLILLNRRVVGRLELVIAVLANETRLRRKDICCVLLLILFEGRTCGIVSMLDPAIAYYIDSLLLPLESPLLCLLD